MSGQCAIAHGGRISVAEASACCIRDAPGNRLRFGLASGFAGLDLRELPDPSEAQGATV